MIPQPMIIASYPRSGSTWLRFVLCHLYYPQVEHDFASVNRFIPPIDDPEGLLNGIDKPLFYKTHAKVTATNILFLHRHVGDVLVSEWWYKKKMWNESRPLEEYLEATEFGKEWREHVMHYYPAQLNFAYHELGDVDSYPWYFNHPSRIEAAIQKADFLTMQGAEMKGFGIYPEGDKQIKFCRKGTTGQWLEWAPQLKDKLLNMNKLQLKMLGYARFP